MPRDDGEWHVLVPVDWSRDPVIFIFENKIRFPDAYKERKEGGAVVLPHPRVYTIDITILNKYSSEKPLMIHSLHTNLLLTG